jgi:hypothetical protein
MRFIGRLRLRITVCPLLSFTKTSGLTRRHHLHGTRPLPQPPLSYLLPSAYLSSLRRTEARVRFAESHAPPASIDKVITEEGVRPGLRRRSTGPKPDGGGNEEEWVLSDLRLKAEEAVENVSKAVANTGEDLEFRQQLDQLNLPIPESSPPRPSTTKMERRRKSNLCAPYPPNMPLALLKLMESYVIGLAEVPNEKGGWAEAKRERGLNLVKSLSSHLGDAERLSSSTFPLSSGYIRLIGSTTPFTPHCPFDGFTTDLPSRYPPLAHVRSERMDVGSDVCHCGMVFPRLRSVDIGCWRSVRSFRYTPLPSTYKKS